VAKHQFRSASNEISNYMQHEFWRLVDVKGQARHVC
jgi:hypothetical protein